MAGLEAAGCTLVRLDVTDDASVAAAAETVGRATGGAGIDILVNNAGATFKGTILDCPPAACAALLDVNVVGAIRVTQAFAGGGCVRGGGRGRRPGGRSPPPPRAHARPPARSHPHPLPLAPAPMCARGRGVIVNVGSATGYVAQVSEDRGEEGGRGRRPCPPTGRRRRRPLPAPPTTVSRPLGHQRRLLGLQARHPRHHDRPAHRARPVWRARPFAGPRLRRDADRRPCGGRRTLARARGRVSV